MQSKPDAPLEAGDFDGMALVGSGRVALVIGSDTRAFLGVVRSLGRQGVTVHVAPFDFTSPALHSRYIARIHRLPSLQAGADATEGAALWVAALSALCARIRPDLIVPCDDRSIIPLQLHAAELTHLRIALPGRDAFEAFFDKGNTRALAQACGVARPSAERGGYGRFPSCRLWPPALCEAAELISVALARPPAGSLGLP
jgi:hypothetical protein